MHWIGYSLLQIYSIFRKLIETEFQYRSTKKKNQHSSDQTSANHIIIAIKTTAKYNPPAIYKLCKQTLKSFHIWDAIFHSSHQNKIYEHVINPRPIPVINHKP